MDINPKDKAHPYTYTGYNDGLVYSEGGLTKREYLAAIAFQGICAGSRNHFQPELYAEYAVKYADALINELNKTNQ